MIRATMFDLWRLKRRRRNRLRFYNREIDTARHANQPATEIQWIESSMINELQDIEDSINAANSDRLWEEAHEFDVEIPSGKEHWESDMNDTRKYLNAAARSATRKAIDEVKARRFEVKTLWVTRFWLPLLAALVGIIGAITGLVAVLHHAK